MALTMHESIDQGRPNFHSSFIAQK